MFRLEFIAINALFMQIELLITSIETVEQECSQIPPLMGNERLPSVVVEVLCLWKNTEASTPVCSILPHQIELHLSARSRCSLFEFVLVGLYGVTPACPDKVTKRFLTECESNKIPVVLNL